MLDREIDISTDIRPADLWEIISWIRSLYSTGSTIIRCLAQPPAPAVGNVGQDCREENLLFAAVQRPFCSLHPHQAFPRPSMHYHSCNQWHEIQQDLCCASHVAHVTAVIENPPRSSRGQAEAACTLSASQKTALDWREVDDIPLPDRHLCTLPTPRLIPTCRWG